MGSPPRGRGKEDDFMSALIFLRITPAWAGKSHRWPHNSPQAEDHPRVGGEKDFCVSHVSSFRGSPPRGRGKAFFNDRVNDHDGITPAWAGKRHQIALVECGQQDHPRVGGEKALRLMYRRMWRGSPPRGRGKGEPGALPRPPSRITPAWAGKSVFVVDYFVSHGDHPRVGGEKTKKIP